MTFFFLPILNRGAPPKTRCLWSRWGDILGLATSWSTFGCARCRWPLAPSLCFPGELAGLVSVSLLLLAFFLCLVVGGGLVPGACAWAHPLGHLASAWDLSAHLSRPVSELPPAPTLLSPPASEPAPHLHPHLLSRPRCPLVWDYPGNFLLPKAELILWHQPAPLGSQSDPRPEVS